MSSKVFDTLSMLVERHGETLSKQEMLDAIWKDAYVEENNLSQKISTLRKLFGPENDFIRTIPKEGFRFVAPVKSPVIEHFETNGKNLGSADIDSTGNSSPNTIESKQPSLEPEAIEKSLPLNSEVARQTSSSGVLYAAAGILITLVLGAFAFNFFNTEKTRNKTYYASFDYVELTDTGDVGTSAISPDGKFIVYTKLSNDETVSSIRIMDIESKNDAEIRIDGNVKPGIVKFSPDGKSIYFRTSGLRKQFENLYRVSRFGGDPKLIAENIWGSFAISPDGEKLTFFRRKTTGLKQQVVVKDIESGEEAVILDSFDRYGSIPRGTPVFSPDQKKIAFIRTQRKARGIELAVVDLETKEIQLIQTDLYSIRELVWDPEGKSFYVHALVLGKSFQLWNISYPDGELSRVTSDADSYRNLSIADDGTISVTRLNAYSNLWSVPKADIRKAQKLTHGANEIGGSLTAQFVPDGNILYNARDKIGAGIRLFDFAAKTSKRWIDKQLHTEHRFSFSKSRKKVFFEFENRIWKANFDGSDVEKVELGESGKIERPAVSFDEKWLFYIKRGKAMSTIWKAPIDGGEAELVVKPDGYAPERFLSASPDGKYLAFVYVDSDKIGKDNANSQNLRKYGFFNLETKELKVITVPAYKSILRWTNGGKTFDFPSFAEKGTAIFRKNVEDDKEPAKVFELENELIYRFDWSPNGTDLLIGRGNRSMNLVILRVPKDKKDQ